MVGTLADGDSLEMPWQFEKSPADSSTLRARAIKLSRQGLREEQRGSLARARAAFEESLDLRRRLLALESRRKERLVDLSVGLDDLGRVLESQGALEEARRMYEESLQLLRRLVSQEPDRREW